MAKRQDRKRRRKDHKGLHLSWDDRCRIERMLNEGRSKKVIAHEIGCCLQTIYNELKRATYEHTETDLSVGIRYSPELAEERYCKILDKKGRTPKLLLDPEQREYLGKLMIEKDYSPAAALMQAKADGKVFKYPVTSVATIYTAIEKGYFEGLTLEMLPERGHHKMKPRRSVKANKQRKRAAKGTSIEQRPEHVELREEFGHWEMDSVIGMSTNKKTILVLTERKTRYERMLILKAHTADEVRKALNRLEQEYGSSFYEIFKSITVDNGSEFSDCYGMEKALYRKNKRTNVYYCHARSPQERGTNEVTNRMVRRVFPKGGDFDRILNRTAVKRAEVWINNYPRAKLDGKTAAQCFAHELNQLGVCA